MHIHFLDVYHPGVSPLHALDARVKLILALAYILALSLLPAGRWPIYVLLLALIVSAALVSGLGIAFAAKRALLAILFILAALPLLFTTAGAPLLSGQLGAWQWTLTAEGLVRFTSIALKAWLSLQAAILLSATTEFPELLMAMRAIRIPQLLVAIVGLMWRYLFILADEAMRLLRAREARSAAHAGGGGSLSWRARVAGHMAGSLFLRGYERSERVYGAMLARGYDGEIRTLPLPPLRASDRVALVVGLGTLFMLILSAS
jgi:cobalt/nickel transport system permease protein